MGPSWRRASCGERAEERWVVGSAGEGVGPSAGGCEPDRAASGSLAAALRGGAGKLGCGGKWAGKKRRVGLPPVFLGLTGSCRVGLVPVLGWVLGLVGFGVLVSFLFLTQLKSKELKLI